MNEKIKSYPPFGPQLKDFVFWFGDGAAIVGAASFVIFSLVT